MCRECFHPLRLARRTELEPIRKAATRHESSFVAAHVQSYIPRLLASFVALATLFAWARRTFSDDLELCAFGLLRLIGACDAECRLLKVDAFRPEGPVHDAIRDRTMHQSNGVTELVQGLNPYSIDQDRLHAWPRLLRRQPSPRRNRSTSPKVRQAEYVRERRDEKVGIGQGKVAKAGGGGRQALEDATRVYLPAIAIRKGTQG